MSVESARAFCVRMMSDEDFRGQLAQVKDAAEIDSLVGKEYSFSKADLGKIIGEFIGHKLEEGELEQLICGFFEEKVEAGNKEVCNVVIGWLNKLA